MFGVEVSDCSLENSIEYNSFQFLCMPMPSVLG